MNFNVLNTILIAYLIASLFYGFKKGLIATVVHWIGLAITSVLIIRYAPMVKTGIMNKFPIGSFLANCLTYLLIFVMIAILAKLIIILLHQIANLLSLSFLNKCFGAVIGFLNAIIILIVIIAIIEIIPYTDSIQKYLNKSYIIQETQKIKETIKPSVIKQINKNKEKDTK